MDAKVKADWVEALRSGVYEQGRDLLHSEDAHGDHRYCCLGVLCELARKEIMVHVQMERDSEGITAYSYDGRDSMLPESVLLWAGLDRDEPSPYVRSDYKPEFVDTDSGTVRLEYLNDGGKSFDEIAALIEADINL